MNQKKKNQKNCKRSKCHVAKRTKEMEAISDDVDQGLESIRNNRPKTKNQPRKEKMRSKFRAVNKKTPYDL